MKYIIRYSGEMTTKSRVVRVQFCRQLKRNVARVLRVQLGLPDQSVAPHDPDAVLLEVQWDNLYLELPASRRESAAEVESLLANMPGIWSFSRVLQYPLTDLQDLLDQTLALYRERLQGKTFRVRCRRLGTHDFSSVDVERFVGAGLRLQTQARGVDLHAPDLVVPIEIRDTRVRLVDAARPGIGGFPIGTQETAISLLSGGFDSAVATYQAMKRGLRAHTLFFNLGGSDHELAVKELAYFLWQKFGASHPTRFISVPFEPVVAAILATISDAMMGVVLKRMMLRAATEVARQLDVGALVTGDSIAQVSSQTLPNLCVIDEATPLLVLRPLAMLDKQEIVDIARRIGTEEFSASIPEYCGVISVRPTTRAKLSRIAEEERRFDFTLLEQALADRKTFDIRTLQSVSARPSAAELDDLTPQRPVILIDIRHPEQQERRPLRRPQYPVLLIPFFRLNAEFPALASDSNYLLYCDHGVLSRLHAAHLQEQGHRNVGIFKTS
jgi:thiamine biosynthesis protein ThiI